MLKQNGEVLAFSAKKLNDHCVNIPKGGTISLSYMTEARNCPTAA